MRYFNNFFIKNIQYITYLYVAIVSILILFFLYQGDDTAFHMQRLDAIANEFKISGFSAFPIRIYHSTLNGYGYASPLFYGDIFFYPFSFLVTCGLKIEWSYKLMLFVTFLSSYFSISFVMNRIALNKIVAEFSIFIYMISVTVYSNSINSCVGREFSMIFMPLAFYGLYSILYDNNDKNNWLYLALGMFGEIFSNIIDAVLCAFTLFVILIFSYKHFSLRKIAKITLSAAVCIGLSAWFVFPMLEQMSIGGFYVTNEYITTIHNDLSKYTVPLVGLILPGRILNLILVKILHLDPSIMPNSYLYGITLMIIVLIYSLIKRKAIAKSSFDKALIVLLTIFIIFQTKLFPHDLLKNYIGVIQFPFRTNLIMTFITVILISKIYANFNKNKFISIISIVSIALLGMSFISTFGLSLAENRLNIKNMTKLNYTSMDVGAGEYIPDIILKPDDLYWFKELITTRTNTATPSNPDVKVELKKDKNDLIISYDNNDSNTLIELPIFMYTGYYAEDILTGESVPIALSKNGLAEITVSNTSGTIRVWYKGTTIQKVSEIISLISIIVFLIYIISKIFLLIIKKKKSPPVTTAVKN